MSNPMSSSNSDIRIDVKQRFNPSSSSSVTPGPPFEYEFDVLRARCIVGTAVIVVCHGHGHDSGIPPSISSRYGTGVHDATAGKGPHDAASSERKGKQGVV